jgi:hypothetical protein
VRFGSKPVQLAVEPLSQPPEFVILSRWLPDEDRLLQLALVVQMTEDQATSVMKQLEECATGLARTNE